MTDDLDSIVLQFLQIYGIRRLFEDFDEQNIKKENSHWMCNCPFHDESNPSFGMNADSGLFHCFACDVSGNIFQFISRKLNLPYKESIEYVKKLAGLDGSVDIDKLLFLNQIKSKFIVEEKKVTEKKSINIDEKVMKQMNTGPDPYKYLESRGFSGQTIKDFECTFTNKWRRLNTETNKYYYDERIVVPLHDSFGKIIAFVGRTPIDVIPKYLYTFGFNKVEYLFNFHRAKQFSSNGLIIVEGPLDAMRLWDLGFKNVVAIYGASPSEEQIDLMLRYTDKIYLAFDNDKAGNTACRKAIDALKNRLDLNVLDISPYKDPGEIKSREEFEKIHENAYNWHTFWLKANYNTI